MKKIFLLIPLFMLGIFVLTGCDFILSSSNNESSSSSVESSSNSESISESINESSEASSTSSETSATSSETSTSSESTSISNVETEVVTNTLSFDPASITIATFTEDVVYGKFTVLSGNSYESSKSAIKAGNTSTPTVSKSIKITLDGPGTVNTNVSSASSSMTADMKLSLWNEDGTEAKGFAFGANIGSSGARIDYSFTDMPAGIYYLAAPKTIRVYSLQTITTVEVSPINGFDILSTGVIDYLEGTNYSSSKVQVVATYASGKTTSLSTSEYTIDSSTYNSSVAGEYTISVSYSTYAAQTFTVTVYEATALNIEMYKLSSSATNVWGNGVLSKLEVPTVFIKGTAFSYDNLTVQVIGEKTGGVQKIFNLDASQYTVSSPTYNTNVTGEYVVNISTELNSNILTSSYEVTVVTDTITPIGNVIYVAVNPNATGTNGLVYTTSTSTVTIDNSYVFTTISDALQFLNKSTISSSTAVMMYICNGTYNEKIDVTIPNLTIVGESEAGVIITYDAYNGLADSAGTSHSTDGSATFNVRATATNFKAKNITFENYYNTLDRYNALKLITSGTQALAVLVQADASVFENCSLTGYQDTLELQGAGRQTFKNCFISGATDFIFGTNSTAYFDNCEIKVIGNGQSDNGGYICAPKGNNKGSDPTAYGYVFNNCQFTNDGNTLVGKTSICRPWSDNATVTIMNSVLGDHISLEGYTTGATKGLRYVTGLSSATPLTSTVLFKEYNNTGAGAITAPVDGVTIIDETAANAILSGIFSAYTVGPEGGSYTFSFNAWTPESPIDFQFATTL